MNQPKVLLLVVSLLLVAAARWPQAKPDELAQGKQLYVNHCALCHGIEGTGGRGPSLNQPKLRNVTSDPMMEVIIRNGIQGTEMPGFWMLGDSEVKGLAAYALSLGRVADIKLTGEPAKGKAVYDAQGCTACHIVGGAGGNLGPELTEIGARRSPAYLRDSLIAPAAAKPEGYLVVSVTTREGRAVRGVRVNEDSFTLQLRDAKGQFHSFRKADLKELKKETGVSTMPSYKQSLTAAELDDLVAYLYSLRGAK
ncbi:MAG: c-type cytochrome [Blastocatellia bacterium]